MPEDPHDLDAAEEATDSSRSRDRAKKVAKCARQCPGVESRPNETCAAGAERASEPCRDYTHEEPVREVNPEGVVAVAIGAAALTALMILWVARGMPVE
jgi:hypothetical protein